MISVIIPVYNVAPYLAACLDSVLAQSYSDLELLLVDDGSTDGSSDLCDDYACRDARVTVMHQSNAGPAAARNAALQVAQGEYVAFVDSDDVIHRQYLEVLMAYMTEGVDVVQAPYQIVDAEQRARYDATRLASSLPRPHSVRRLSAHEALLGMFYQRPSSANSSPCKLFRRGVLEGLKFPTAFRVYEDLYFMAQLYPHLRSMVCVDVPVYFYFKQATGTLCSQSIRRTDGFAVLETLEAQFMVQGQRDVVRAVRERRLSVAFNILRLLARQPHTDANIAQAHRCWQHIKALRRESLCDTHARLKNRLTALASYLIYR